MRLVHYYIIEKATGKKVYTNCRPAKVEEVLQNMKNKENYCIGYKWLSI
jgi:hypothetical protein